MSDQAPRNNNNNNNNSNRRPHNNDQRRRPHHNNQNNNQNRPRPQGQNRPDSSKQQVSGNHSQGGQQNNQQGQSGNNNNRRRNNNYRRNRNQKRPANTEARGPVPASEKRPSFLDRAYEKYQNLLDQHLIARKKYFELFYRADPQQKNKLERNFYQTLNDLRDYEEKLTPETKEYLDFKTNGRAIDIIYSSNHEISTVGVNEVENDKIEDPHLLPSQVKADYANDTEESVGTLDDYRSYKGI